MLSGVNHITFLTGDLDRLVVFYEEVFGATRVMKLPIPEPEGPGRHALIAIGAGASLHVFEFAGSNADCSADVRARSDRPFRAWRC